MAAITSFAWSSIPDNFQLCFDRQMRVPGIMKRRKDSCGSYIRIQVVKLFVGTSICAYK